MWHYAKWYQCTISRIEKINKLNNKQISAQPIGTLAYQHIIKLWNLHLNQLYSTSWPHSSQ